MTQEGRMNEKTAARPGDLARTLLQVASRDTGQARRIAGVLLSLWDGDAYRCDIQGVLYVDSQLFTAVVQLLVCLRAAGKQLDSVIEAAQIAPVIRMWGDIWAK
jgi:hypothetical protein